MERTGEFYIANTEGISFMILAQPRPSLQTSDLDDKVLNILAWSAFVSMSNLSVSDKWGDSFEMNFIRKETLSGQPAKIYRYTSNSCKDKKDGLFIALLGKKYNYVINISGANEQDARTQRFLKSLKIAA
jgi:hypothetical protein